MDKRPLIDWIDSYLKVRDIPDGSRNGLQIDAPTKRKIRKIGYAVDATLATAKRAAKEKCDLLVVHHGLLWGAEQALTGTFLDRVSKFLFGGVGLYAAHLPLDAHPEVGNNAGIANALARALGVKKPASEPFGKYHGVVIGVGLRWDTPVPVAKFRAAARKLGIVDDFQNWGAKKAIRSVAIVSGGAGSMCAEAHEKGYDVLLTGEGAHHEKMLARDLGQSVLYGGHYETETFGARLLAEKIAAEFGITVVRIDA